MTSITIRTDESIKSILEHDAKVNGLTLSSYINLLFRRHIANRDDELMDFVDERRLKRELAIAQARADNPSAEYVSLDEAFAALDKKHDLRR